MENQNKGLRTPNYGATAPRRIEDRDKSKVNTFFNEMGNSLDQLSGLINNLENRLSPVLEERPENLQIAKTAEQLEPLSIVSKIDTNTNAINSACSRLDSIINRLEI